MTNHIIIKTVEHKGIGVTIKVDYDAGTCSLVEKNQYENWKAKEYRFSGRGLEYMNGWLNILQAMQEAVKEGKIMLEADLDQKSCLKEELIIKALADRPLNFERDLYET